MEEFSVSELDTFRRKSGYGDQEAVYDLVAGNLAISGERDYRPEPDFEQEDTDYALTLLVHDAAVNLYELNEQLDSEDFFEQITDDIIQRIEDEQALSKDIIWEQVYGTSVKDTVDQLADYYSENFEQASHVETEKLIENNGFTGRTDIVREVGGETELRDIKTRYSDRRPLPDEDEKFKIACYALISRQELDIDRFILEYPLQGEEVKIDPRERFSDIAGIAEEYRQMLETAREVQAEMLEEDMGLEKGEDPRKFVEGLNLGRTNRDYAEAAVTEGLK